MSEAGGLEHQDGPAAAAALLMREGRGNDDAEGTGSKNMAHEDGSGQSSRAIPDDRHACSSRAEEVRFGPCQFSPLRATCKDSDAASERASAAEG